MQLFVALIAAAAVVWLLKTGWCPVVRQAIWQLPDGSEMRHQQLAWKGLSPAVLAENRFLALVVDLDGAGAVGSVADVRVQFQKDQIEICSLFGCLALEYPKGWAVAFDRTNLEPWWNAREFAILTAAGATIVIALMLSWVALATAYFAIAYWIAYLLDRDLSWSASWRLSGAALMPGGLFLTVGIALYGLQGISLVRLMVVFLVHLVIGWLYVLLTPFFLKRTAVVPSLGKNPFAATSSSQADSSKNPFSGQA